MQTLDEIECPVAQLTFIAEAMKACRQPKRAVTPPRPVALTASSAPAATPPPPRSAPQLTDADRELIETSVHEAGHAVAAVALGGRISHGYVLPLTRRTGEITGRVVVESMPIGDATAQIAFAGPWAQARWRAGEWPTAPAVEAILASAGRLDKRMCDRSGSGGGSVARLLDRCWPAVLTVAQELIRVGEIRHTNVVAALGLSDDTTRHGFELASIRAGLTSVQ